MSDTRFTFEVEGLQETLQDLVNIAPMFQGKKGFPGNPLRNAVRAGTKPIVEIAKAKALALGDREAAFGGYDATGRLSRAIDIRIVSVKERDPFTGRGDSLEAYDIGYRTKGSEGAPYGGFVELGTIKMAAQPYLRPAIAEGGDRAVKAIRDKLAADLKRIKKKLASLK